MYTSFKDMPVWQEAMALAEEVFRATEKLPRKEDYGLTSQIRRAALSVPSNIAEAFGRSHALDKAHFYYVARGSIAETQTQLEYARRVGYLKPEAAGSLDQRLTKLYHDLNKLIMAVKSSKT